MTLSDLEWHSKIFNDVKHRARDLSATAEFLVFCAVEILQFLFYLFNCQQ